MAQQTVNVGTGVETGDGEISRTAWMKVNANFTDVYAQIATLSVNLGSLGTAAALNVGNTIGTVADGGALTAETSRAIAAETANATAISVETTRATAAEAALQAAIGQTSTVFAVNYTAQSLTSAQQLQARQNISAVASGDSVVLGNGSTATTQSAGDNTTKVATNAFVTGAITSYAGTVASTYAPLASPAFTGTPTVPTAATGTNSLQAASTGFVIGAVAPAPTTPSSNTTLTAADHDRPLFVTGTTTVTAANGGAGWRSGTVRNANTGTGLVTLTVPSGATLDGVTDGTTILFPYQRARIIQTGATAYVTDWIDRAPVIARMPPGAAVANWDIPLPAGYSTFRIVIKGALPTTNASALLARLSDDGGTTIKAGSTDYGQATIDSGSASGVTGGASTSTSWPLSGAISTAFNKAMIEMRLDPGGGGDRPVHNSRISYVNSGGGTAYYDTTVYGGACVSISTNRANLLRLLWSASTGVAGITVYGEP